jgi:hypothetical protein
MPGIESRFLGCLVRRAVTTSIVLSRLLTQNNFIFISCYVISCLTVVPNYIKFGAVLTNVLSLFVLLCFSLDLVIRLVHLQNLVCVFFQTSITPFNRAFILLYLFHSSSSLLHLLPLPPPSSVILLFSMFSGWTIHLLLCVPVNKTNICV